MDCDTLTGYISDASAHVPMMADEATAAFAELEESPAFRRTGTKKITAGNKFGVYIIIAKIVEKIWKTYSREDPAFLNSNEIKLFLEEFLKNHDCRADARDIVFQNMDKDGNGKIDKYEMTVFFLELAQYEDLLVQKDIEKYTGFKPTA